MARITLEAFNRLLGEGLPLVAALGMRAEAIGAGTARVVLPFSPQITRPGGTVMGPMLMAVADCAMYAALLGAIGPVPLAVTSTLTINFLRKPGPADVIGECRALRLGRRSAVFEVTLFSAGSDEAVAHATGAYTIPPETEGAT
ncbi:MAG: PaaI family thioesterase [Alphaproteobacteria bacterium]